MRIHTLIWLHKIGHLITKSKVICQKLLLLSMLKLGMKLIVLIWPAMGATYALSAKWLLYISKIKTNPGAVK